MLESRRIVARCSGCRHQGKQKKKTRNTSNIPYFILDFVISTPIRKVSTLYNKICKNIFNFQTMSILVDFRLGDTLFLARCPLLADVAIIHAEDKR